MQHIFQSVQNSSASEQSGYDAEKIWNQTTNCYRQNRLFISCCRLQGKDKKIFVDDIEKLLSLNLKNGVESRNLTKNHTARLESNNSRRLSKNYEYSMSSAETMVKISHIYTLLNRL